MKKYSIVFLICLLTQIGCQTEILPENDFGDCFEVTIVESLCGTAIFRIENPAFYRYGENANGYKNVFMGNIPCSDFRTAQSNSAQTKLFVKISTEAFPENDNNCVRCAALPAYDGTKSYFIKFVSSCSEKKMD